MTELAASIWDRRLAWVTGGAVALVLLAATQALAVTTVMPIVAADLDGKALFALAFSGILATSVVGMVVTGVWSDRSGPKGPLYVSVGLFVVGLVLAGLATSMPMLVTGRLVQGFGVGGQTVALYVVVARVYPAHLHGRVFAAFSAAWVLPSLVGPFLAGVVTELFDWRWVFLGVAALTAAAFATVAVRLHDIDLHTSSPVHRGSGRRIALSLVVAAAVIVLGLSSEVWPGMWAVPVVVVGLVVIAARPLLPPRTMSAARGLPSVILTRGLLAAAFFGAEVYIPYLLIDRYAWSPAWAGLGLATAALAWAAAAWVQGRWGEAIGNPRLALSGILLLVVAIGGAWATAIWSLTPALTIVSWTLGGVGMGLLYPRLTVLTLAYSTPQNQGSHSAALSISDSVGAAMALAVAGLIFVALGAGGPAFAAVFAFTGVLAVLTLLPGLRIGRERERVTPRRGPLANSP